VLGRSREPILAPEAPYETSGFFSKVVFTCGAILLDDEAPRMRTDVHGSDPSASVGIRGRSGLVRVYYGAADGVTAAADLSLDEILAGLE
jgi:predicted GH43/DUF377 family glycosyl hydrolase